MSASHGKKLVERNGEEKRRRKVAASWAQRAVGAEPLGRGLAADAQLDFNIDGAVRGGYV
jgi:hypothetical protein